jgi:hypothetical protein
MALRGARLRGEMLGAVDHFGQGMLPKQPAVEPYHRRPGRVRDHLGPGMLPIDLADPAADGGQDYRPGDAAYEAAPAAPRRRPAGTPKITPKITGAAPSLQADGGLQHRTKFGRRGFKYDADPSEWYGGYRPREPQLPPQPPPPPLPPRRTPEEELEHQAMVEAIEHEMEVIAIQMDQLAARRITLQSRLASMG